MNREDMAPIVDLAVDEARALLASGALPYAERAPLDAYWTPAAVARVCVEALRDDAPGAAPEVVIEPCVGGGSWLREARAAWPSALLAAVEIDALAPGLALAEAAHVGDFRAWARDYAELKLPRRGALVVGNPPYSGDTTTWIDAARSVAGTVGFLLRATILGSQRRAAWWRANPPAVVYWLTSRPRWEGPGARSSTDTSDSVFVVWREDGPPSEPVIRWLTP